MSSASFDPVESICPSILLVFYLEDGLRLGPWKASLPTWVGYNTFKQNLLSRLFPFWESFSSPPPPIVTSDMLLWCLRHIFLMFYTPYNPRCAKKARFTCWHNWWCLWPCKGQADNEVFITTDTVRTHERTHTHTDNPTYVDAAGLSFVSCVYQDCHFQLVSVFAKQKKSF